MSYFAIGLFVASGTSFWTFRLYDNKAFPLQAMLLYDLRYFISTDIACSTFFRLYGNKTFSIL